MPPKTTPKAARSRAYRASSVSMMRDWKWSRVEPVIAAYQSESESGGFAVVAGAFAVSHRLHAIRGHVQENGGTGVAECLLRQANVPVP